MPGVGNSVVASQIRGLEAERASTTLKYEADTLNIPENTTNYDVKANSDKLFEKINIIREITLRVNDGSIGFSLNSTGEDIIDLLKNEVYEMEGFPISNIYISTGSNPAVVRIVIIGWN